MTKIFFYEEPYYFFSNFSAHAIDYNGRLYPTSEHAYQATKFESDEIIEKIRTAKSPLLAKYLSNEVYKEYKKKDWDKIKLEIMYEIIKEKVEQHEEVRQSLINTTEEIIENSPVDYYWGGGKDGTGQNHLGKILMRIRNEVLKGYHR